LLGQERLQPGESAFVQIRLEEPTFALPGDRFIVRQYSPMITIGGGEVLDAMPEKHRRADRSVVERLRILKDGAVDERIIQIVERAGHATMEISQLAAASGLTPARLREQVHALSKKGDIRVLSENPYVIISARSFREMAEATALAVQRFHESNPLVPGISREELKARVFNDAPALLFQSVIDALAAGRRIAVAQDLIHEFGRRVTLKADEERMRAQLAERFKSLALQVPVLDEVIDGLKLDRQRARKIIQLMVNENEIVKISEEMFVERSAIEKLIVAIKALKGKTPKFGVGEFKNLTGVTRKHAIPLLEYLDRQRITRRIGDEPVIL
jgi:selenocysteine-specific elongation factor